MTLTADGLAKSTNPFHEDQDTFTLNVSLTVSGGSSAPGVAHVQNTIIGDVFEVVPPEKPGASLGAKRSNVGGRDAIHQR